MATQSHSTIVRIHANRTKTVINPRLKEIPPGVAKLVQPPRERPVVSFATAAVAMNLAILEVHGYEFQNKVINILTRRCEGGDEGAEAALYLMGAL